MCKELHYTEESFWFNLKVKFLAFDLFVHFFFNEAPRSTETEDRNICGRYQRVQRLPFVYNNGMNCISIAWIASELHELPLCMIYNVCKIYKFTFSTNSFCTIDFPFIFNVQWETSMCLCRYTFQMKMSVNVCVRWYKISQIIHVQLHTTNSTRLLSLMLDCTRAFSLSLFPCCRSLLLFYSCCHSFSISRHETHWFHSAFTLSCLAKV